MAADRTNADVAPASSGKRPRGRLIGLVGALAALAAVYLSLPRSWFTVPDENAPAPVTTSTMPAPAAPPAAAPPVPDRETLRAAAAQTPLDYGARSRYGMALAAVGRGPDALKEFEAARRLAPESPGVHHNLGVFYLNAGQSARAEAAFCRELELAPGDGRAHYFRGLALQARRKDAEATRQFEQAVALAPDFPDAYLSLALQTTRTAPEARIRQLVDQYVALTGNRALGHYVLSGAYRTWKRYAEAAREAEASVQMEPENYGYWHNLGQIYSYDRKIADADRALQRALSLARDPSTVLIELGMNAQKGARFPDAATYFQKALAASPSTGNINLYLARAYQQMGDQAAARKAEAAFRQWERHKQERRVGTPPAAKGT